MISFIRGRLAGVGSDSAFIDNNGIGFQIFMSSRSLAALGSVGEEVAVHTYLQVREDALTLFGFSDEEERSLFEKLISVSGVGAKVALSALSSFAPKDLISAIICQDNAAIQKIPGVGKKMASRIVLELKDAFGSLEEIPFNTQQGVGDTALPLAAVSAALLSMGFSSAEVNLALKDAPEGDESSILGYALRRLGGPLE